jgi:transposase-like protein
MNVRDDQLRARVARGWTESGLSQPEYARQHGISERTLRAWRAKYCADRQPPGEAVREAIVDAMERLQAALDVLDRAAAEAEAHDEQAGSLSGSACCDGDIHKADAASVVPDVGGDVAPSAAVREDGSSRSRREQSTPSVAPRGRRTYFSDL